MKWLISEVRLLEAHRLELFFSNAGEYRIFDMTPYLREKPFVPLSDPERFRNVRLIGGSIGWDDDIDIAPEFLYENSIPAATT